jgi:hypothetical protein
MVSFGTKLRHAAVVSACALSLQLACHSVTAEQSKPTVREPQPGSRQRSSLAWDGGVVGTSFWEGTLALVGTVNGVPVVSAILC